MMLSCMTAQEEEELIKRVRLDKTAFLQIYDSHFNRIYNYSYFRTMNQNEAEEVTSQTFLIALENIQRYEYRGIPIVVWLYKIAANVMADIYRKRHRITDLPREDLWLDSSQEPEAIIVQKSEKERIHAFLKDLPPLQQQALILRYIQDLSYKEIAEILEKTEGAVKQLLHRGLTSLRERMVCHE